MSRLCGQPTATGEPCSQLVEDHHDHCEAGHRCPPARTVSRFHSLRPTGSSLAVDDLYGASIGDSNPPRDEIELPAWRARTGVLGALAGAVVAAPSAAAGVHNAGVLVALAIVGAAPAVFAGYVDHRSAARTARESFRVNRLMAAQGQRIASLQAATTGIQRRLEGLTVADGEARTRERGGLEAVGLRSIEDVLPPNASVRFYRRRGGALVAAHSVGSPTGAPSHIADGSDDGALVRDAMENSSPVLVAGNPGEVDRLFAPIASGSVLFGLIYAEAPHGAITGDDCELVGAYARYVGLGEAIGAGLLGEATANDGGGTV